MINVWFDGDQTFKHRSQFLEFEYRPIFRAFCDRCLSAVPLVRIVARWKLEATENGGMWNFMYGSKTVLAGFVVILMTFVTASDVASQSQTSALVKHRQSMMKQMGLTSRVFVPILKGQNKNVRDAVAAAATVNTIAKQISAIFPQGTGRDAVPGSRAKPEVWSQRGEFEAAAAKLVEESGKLISAASTNQIQTFRTQFKAFVTACGGCHSGKAARGGKFRFAKN